MINIEYKISPIHRRKHYVTPTVIITLILVVLICYSPIYEIFRGLKGISLFCMLWMVCILIGLSVDINKQGAIWRKIKPQLIARRRELFFLFIWLFIITANTILDRGAGSGIYHFFAMCTITVFYLMGVYYSSKDNRIYRFISILIMVILGLIALSSLRTLIFQSGIARLVMKYSGEFYTARSKGVGEYGIYTAGAIIFPVLLAIALQSEKWLKLFLLFLCIIIAIAITFSTFTGPFFLLCLGIICFSILVINQGKRKKFKRIFIILILTFIILNVYSKYLVSFSQWQYSTTKISRLYTGISSKGLIDGDVTGRAIGSLYSIESWTEHPIFGVGPYTWSREQDRKYRFGGHSSWIDTLTEYGLFGFGFYIIFLYICSKRIYRSWKSNKYDLMEQGRWLSCLLFIFYGFLNPIIFKADISGLFYFFVLGKK